MSDEVRVYNCGRQVIPLQIRRPGGDFFRDEQTIHLGAGKSVVVPRPYLNEDQVKQLQANRHIKLLNA